MSGLGLVTPPIKTQACSHSHWAMMSSECVVIDLKSVRGRKRPKAKKGDPKLSLQRRCDAGLYESPRCSRNGRPIGIRCLWGGGTGKDNSRIIDVEFVLRVRMSVEDLELDLLVQGLQETIWLAQA